LLTGELCPECKKGKLYPIGKSERTSTAEYPISRGQEEFASDYYKCDNPKCGHSVRELAVKDQAKGIDTASVTKKP
jgi:hypothetical protein